MDRDLHCPRLLPVIWPISENIAERSSIVAFPSHPQQTVDCEAKLAHPAENLAVQVHIGDESPAEGEESDTELGSSPSHDKEVDGGKVCPRDTHTLGHEACVRFCGFSLPVDQASHQGIAAASRDHTDREADGLRPIWTTQEPIVDFMDESVTRDDNNPTPGGEVKGGEDLLSMAWTLSAKNLPNDPSLLFQNVDSRQQSPPKKNFILNGVTIPL